MKKIAELVAGALPLFPTLEQLALPSSIIRMMKGERDLAEMILCFFTRFALRSPAAHGRPHPWPQGPARDRRRGPRWAWLAVPSPIASASEQWRSALRIQLPPSATGRRHRLAG